MNKSVVFLIGCIGARLAISITAKNVSKQNLKYMGYLFLIPAIGIITLYIADLRTHGFEAQGKIWWNKVRPLHGVLFLLFSIYAIKQEDFAWMVLLFDTLIGLLIWTHKNLSA